MKVYIVWSLTSEAPVIRGIYDSFEQAVNRASTVYSEPRPAWRLNPNPVEITELTLGGDSNGPGRRIHIIRDEEED